MSSSKALWVQIACSLSFWNCELRLSYMSQEDELSRTAISSHANTLRRILSDYRFVGAQLALDNTRDSIYCFKDSRLAAYLLTAYLAWIVVYESSLDSSSTMPT